MERQHQMLIDKQEEKQNIEGKRDAQQVKQQEQQQQQQQLNPAASPPSASSSSPSHEFSFTVSLHPQAATKIPPEKNKSPPPFAIDLSPADEIFFHGHLLPLHLLSHLPVSPRSSTNSLDSFTLPIKELSQDKNTISTIRNCNDDDQHIIKTNSQENSTLLEGKTRAAKSKPFSLFGLPRWRREKGSHQDDDHRQKKKSRFDLMSHVMQRYMRLIKPLLSFRNRRGDPHIHRQPPFSFSGNLRVRSKKELKGRRGGLSAPASMRTSPTNSGLLVASSGSLTPTTSSDSTMEELQAAIQAAIAHCKKSIAAEDRTILP